MTWNAIQASGTGKVAYPKREFGEGRD